MRRPFATAWPWWLFLPLEAPAVAQESGRSGSGPARCETGHPIVVRGETVQYDAAVAGMDPIVMPAWRNAG